MNKCPYLSTNGCCSSPFSYSKGVYCYKNPGEQIQCSANKAIETPPPGYPLEEHDED